MAIQKYFKGQVWIVNFKDLEFENGVIAKTRPCLILSNNIINSNNNGIIVLPITSSTANDNDIRNSYKFINMNNRYNWVLPEQIKTVAVNRFENYIYSLSDDMMRDVEILMCKSLGILPVSGYELAKTPEIVIAEPKVEHAPLVSTREIQKLSNRFIITKEKINEAIVIPEPVKKVRWTISTKIDFLKDYDVLSSKELMMKYGLTTEAQIEDQKDICRESGLKSAYATKWTIEKKINFLTEYETMSAEEMMIKYNFKKITTIYNYKNKFEKEDLGYKPTVEHKKWTDDEKIQIVLDLNAYGFEYVKTKYSVSTAVYDWKKKLG